MHWERSGYRIIPEYPAYKIGRAADVWSMERPVRCKGGGTRLEAATMLKPSTEGRVSLSQDGRVKRYHVHRELLPAAFPELLEKPQAICRNGHLYVHR
jgi:hypothetical protein